MVDLVRNSPYKDANDFLIGIRTNGFKVQNEETWEENDEF